MNKRKWAIKKSDVQSDSSTILTMNSRAGCDMTWLPSPRPYHFPVHHARLVSSCLNSRERNTDIRTLFNALWIAVIAISPSTACDGSQDSKNHWNKGQYGCEARDRKKGLTRNSTKAISPIRESVWAVTAINEPNLEQHVLSIGPRKIDTMNRTMRTAAFQTTGPREMTAIRRRGEGPILPVTGSGNDLTNMYAMT